MLAVGIDRPAQAPSYLPRQTRAIVSQQTRAIIAARWSLAVRLGEAARARRDRL